MASEIDAAELARLRHRYRDDLNVLALLDALEKARGERGDATYLADKRNDRICELLEEILGVRSDRDSARAERDYARALLREALPWMGHMSDNPDTGLRARIAKELGQ